MTYQTEEEHHARSNFVRGLVQRTQGTFSECSDFAKRPPKRIVQFWNDLEHLPEDVKECIESWNVLENQNFEHLLFDENQARDYIRINFGQKHENAYLKCYHPAMQSDYFRLCYILNDGGCYVDADDVFNGHAIQHLFEDSRLKIQPLCYDITTDNMISSEIFTKPGVTESSWIFYFNNNPLIAGSGHPVIERALSQATATLEGMAPHRLSEIQSTTGPGNLTKSIFNAVNKNIEIRKALLILNDWENVATSRWPLSYRNDERNWRLSNQRDYRKSKKLNDMGDK